MSEPVCHVCEAPAERTCASCEGLVCDEHVTYSPSADEWFCSLRPEAYRDGRTITYCWQHQCRVCRRPALYPPPLDYCPRHFGARFEDGTGARVSTGGHGAHQARGVFSRLWRLILYAGSVLAIFPLLWLLAAMASH